MRRLVSRMRLRRYAAAWLYLGLVVVAELCLAALSRHDQLALGYWLSTNVDNLEHDPVLTLAASAFFPPESLLAWPVLVAMALFGANHVLGNWRTVAVCGLAQLAGTLVSEGIVAYRVHSGALPDADRHLLDIGPSYVVVAAIAVAVLYGPWLARALALADLAVLVFAGHIFAGLSQLQVSAVGHLTALLTGALLGGVLTWRRRGPCQRARPRADGPANGTGDPGELPGGVVAFVS
jgi:Rhomboid-like protein